MLTWKRNWGCKITPAHDPNDFEVAMRHDLPMINMMNNDGTINENGGKYEGLDRFEARKQIVADLKKNWVNCLMQNQSVTKLGTQSEQEWLLNHVYQHNGLSKWTN